MKAARQPRESISIAATDALAGDDLALPLDGFVRKRRLARLDSGRSRRIVWTKWLLALLAVGVAAALLVWPSKHAAKSTYSQTAARAAPKGVMEFPRFSGIDIHNRPYELTALETLESFDAATGAPAAAGTAPVTLVRPQAEMTLKNGLGVAFTAKNGLYDEKGGRLKLMGDVVFGYAGRGEASMPMVDIDLAKNFAWSDQPVSITGDFGHIEGQGIRVYNGGDVVVVTGKSHALLNGGAQKPAAGDVAAPVTAPASAPITASPVAADNKAQSQSPQLKSPQLKSLPPPLAAPPAPQPGH